MEVPVPIWTIGYGNRKITEFIDLLKQNNIQFLIDIRSRPTSKYNPDFSRVNLISILKEHNIRYVFMGDTLGGLPQNEECYTNGRVDYSKVETQHFYKNGIKRLQTAWEKQIPVSIMCSEGKPEECHRSKLIGQTLDKLGINMSHIDQNGKQITQQEVLDRLTNGQLTLFDEPFTSRKQYLK